MNLSEILFVLSALSIWSAIIYNLLLLYNGYKYYISLKKIEEKYLDDMNYFPPVTILIPGHNEEKVIIPTLEAMTKLDYPKEKLEVIFINDNSTDNTKVIYEKFQKNNNYSYIKMIETSKEKGGRGKSGALNYGLDYVKTDYLVVYDADNTPEPLSLKYLVKTITAGNYGAVIGKFRTRNKNKNLLTRMINIEGISFQWLGQGGRSNLFNLCTIPGTNYIISVTDLKKIGGFDPNALAEDTEISIKLYKMGKIIKFMPLAVTWEQEPETLKVFWKQRSRWIEGNLYVLFKYWKTNPFNPKNKYFIDILSYFLIYILFLFSILISDIIMILNLFFEYNLNVIGNLNFVWFLSFLIYIFSLFLTLSFEKEELNKETYLIVILSYFTYTQLWIFIAVKSFFKFIGDRILKKEIKWYKTERFE